MRGCDQGGEGDESGEIERVVRLGVAMTLVTSIGGAANAFTFTLQRVYVYMCACVYTTIIVTLYVELTRGVGT